MKRFPLFLLFFAFGLGFVQMAAANRGVAQLSGTDFEGGASGLFGSIKYGAWGVNYIYAQATGNRSRMQARFTLEQTPQSQLFLHLRATNQNTGGASPIAIAINDHVVHEGTTPFPNGQWAWETFSIPSGILKQGENIIRFSNLQAEGSVGSPPWFMVHRCIIGTQGVARLSQPEIDEDFHITLPKEKSPFPEPYSEGEKESGFAFRGTKGWLWKAEQYLEEIPTLVQCKMNFLMVCYGSMVDIENYGWGHPEANRWWEPLPEKKRLAYERVIKECQNHGIEFCFGMNPNLGSKRILDYSSAKDYDDLWQHYEWAQNLGVKWFNISLDDITHGIDASGQSKLVNEVFRRLRQNDPNAQMIFTPTHYWGTGEDDPYLATLADEIHPDVYLFWTGPQVVSASIRREEAQAYRNVVRHRLFIWDNYPVNDGFHTLHLGPVVHRDPDLPEVADGYMANPMHTQNQSNRLPLMTCGDYAYNPHNYDPSRSIAQAIMYLGETREQREALKNLVEFYPGMLVVNHPSTSWNPVREQFLEIMGKPHSYRLALAYLQSFEAMVKQMEKAFPRKFEATRKTILDDLHEMRTGFDSKYVPTESSD